MNFLEREALMGETPNRLIQILLSGSQQCCTPPPGLMPAYRIRLLLRVKLLSVMICNLSVDKEVVYHYPTGFKFEISDGTSIWRDGSMYS